MTILRAHATPLAAAICLVLAAPATSHAAGYLYFKDSPIVGELPAPPSLATPTQPGTPPTRSTDIDGRDFLVWQRGGSPAPKGGVQKFHAPGALKAK